MICTIVKSRLRLQSPSQCKFHFDKIFVWTWRQSYQIYLIICLIERECASMLLLSTPFIYVLNEIYQMFIK